MVDALHEAHRVLRPGGVVADIPPELGPGDPRRRCIRAEVRWDGQSAPAGIMRESMEYIPEYVGADRAVARVLRDGLFWLERSELFWLRTHFRDLPAVERHIEVEWTGTTLPAQTRRSLVTLLRRHPLGRIVAEAAFRPN